MTYLSDMEVLVDQTIPRAMRMVGAVRDDGLPTIARILAPLTDQERSALIVVLAAMIDPERPVSELLDWVSTGTNEGTLSLFGLAPSLDETSDNPRLWSDLQCHELAKRHRRVNIDLSEYERARLLAGSREWDRRRKARRRASPQAP